MTARGSKDSRYKPVVQAHAQTGDALHFWISGTEAARHVRVAQSAISLCARGGRREAGGFQWRFATEEDMAKVGGGQGVGEVPIALRHRERAWPREGGGGSCRASAQKKGVAKVGGGGG